MGGKTSPAWWACEGEVVRLSLAIQAGAKQSGVLGEHDGALKIKIAAPAVDGAANRALIAFLAERLGLRQRDVTLVRGQSSKRKLVHLDLASSSQAPGELLARLLTQESKT